MQALCIASNNTHKIEELRALLGTRFNIKSMAEIGCFDDIEEYGKTLEENAEIKARHIFQKYRIACLADDSGLEIEALDMRPGVFSARYAGTHGDHEANMEKVLAELSISENRKAQFRTVIHLILSETETYAFDGKVTGNIIYEKRGNGGFGYDPIFVPDGYSQTFAELSAEIKNTISHRAEAVKKLIETLCP